MEDGLLVKLCRGMEDVLNSDNECTPHTIGMFSGMKGSEWHTDIYVDGQLIHKQSMFPAKGDKIMEIKKAVEYKVLQEVFISGVLSSKITLEKFKQDRATY